MKQQKQGVKMQPYQGADGNLYFNFCNGLKVLLRERISFDNIEEYTLEICGCHYIGNTEYYDVKRDGRLLPQPLSANRVKYLVSRYGVITLESGHREALPLTVSEAQQYYNHLEQLRATYQKKAEALAGYVAAREAVTIYNYKIGIALAADNIELATELTDQKKAAWLAYRNLLSSNGIPIDFIHFMRCKQCGGKGYTSVGVCSCAVVITERIRAYCAKERLKSK